MVRVRSGGRLTFSGLEVLLEVLVYELEDQEESSLGLHHVV